jgi:Bacterial Ig-like domain
MKTKPSLARVTCPNTMAGRLRTACATTLLPLLVLASLAEAPAQPAIISTIPAEMATGVPTTAPVVFTFSKAMNTSPSVTFAQFQDSSLLPNNPSFLQPVTLSWSASNTVLTCTPNPAFPTNKTISWAVVGTDLAGNSLESTNPAIPQAGFFTTGSVSEGTNAQPLILSMVPRNFGPLASPTAPIVFTFNKPMNPSATAPVFIDTDAPIPPFYGILPTLPVWSAGNTVLTCSPMQGYPFPTNHTITWSVSGTDVPGHLLTGQAGVFAPRSGGPNTNDTTSFTLSETCMYDQATAGAATLDPMATYVFGVTALVVSNSPASNASLTLPDSSVAELGGDSLVPKSFLWTEGITAPASFDATFPSGNYVFNLQGTTPTQRVTLNFPSGLIQPNAPHVNNFAAAQAVNPALPFLLSWDPFQGGGTADIVAVTIGDHPVFTTVPPGGGPGTLNGTSTSVLIPAGTFQPNGHYDAFITFERVKGTNNSTNFTAVIRATITRFVVTTTTSTSTYVVSGVGVRTNRFGFTITGTSNLVIVVEACTNVAHPTWSPVGTNTLTGGSSYFSDPQWTNYPRRFYRLRSP